MALILALESHHSKKFDCDRAVALISEGTVKGFVPAIQPVPEDDVTELIGNTAGLLGLP